MRGGVGFNLQLGFSFTLTEPLKRLTAILLAVPKQRSQNFYKAKLTELMLKQLLSSLKDREGHKFRLSSNKCFMSN